MTATFGRSDKKAGWLMGLHSFWVGCPIMQTEWERGRQGEGPVRNVSRANPLPAPSPGIPGEGSGLECLLIEVPSREALSRFDVWGAVAYNARMPGLSYEQSGVNYDRLDAFKRACQRSAATTTSMLAVHGM